MGLLMNKLIQFFELMEQIHFVFGLPVQYQTLETTLEGTIL
jgi:hypothetical protein